MHPRVFRLWDGAARETPGAGTADPFGAVGILWNLWPRMQLRWWCGQGHPAL